MCLCVHAYMNACMHVGVGISMGMTLYYNNNGSDVYSCLLDCSKAFDRIRHDKLLQKLISTGLPPVITRSLMNIYVDSHIRVRWKNAVSEPFGATTGVKQGSVLSPILVRRNDIIIIILLLGKVEILIAIVIFKRNVPAAPLEMHTY